MVWLRLYAPNAGCLGLIPTQGTRFCMLYEDNYVKTLEPVNITLFENRVLEEAIQLKILKWENYHQLSRKTLNPVTSILISSCCCSVTESCPTLCDPMDCSPPGSSVHGISQARILEWGTFSSTFSRGSSWFTDRTCITCIGRQILYHWVTREAPL